MSDLITCTQHGHVMHCDAGLGLALMYAWQVFLLGAIASFLWAIVRARAA